MKRWTAGSAAALFALVVVALTAAPAGVAKDGDIRVVGRCTGSTTSKIKLSAENGRIEVEFEVDQNRNGVRWAVVVSRPTRVLFRGARVTRPPSGSLERDRGHGRPRPIRARATSPAGEVCRAAATFRAGV